MVLFLYRKKDYNKLLFVFLKYLISIKDIFFLFVSFFLFIFVRNYSIARMINTAAWGSFHIT